MAENDVNGKEKGKRKSLDDDCNMQISWRRRIKEHLPRGAGKEETSDFFGFLLFCCFLFVFFWRFLFGEDA